LTQTWQRHYYISYLLRQHTANSSELLFTLCIKFRMPPGLSWFDDNDTYQEVDPYPMVHQGSSRVGHALTGVESAMELMSVGEDSVVVKGIEEPSTKLNKISRSTSD
jgi:hypothetical protein